MSGFSSQLVILLTSTIAPEGADVEKVLERRQQYEAALNFWLRHPDLRISGIVYIDNSGYDLRWADELAANLGGDKEFESLSCPDNNIPEGMHYGYPELGLIDYSICKSQLLKKSNYFAKVTGRFTYPKLPALLDSFPVSFDACLDYRFARRVEGLHKTRLRARTQLMFFRREFYEKKLLHQRQLMFDYGISHIEELMPCILVPGDTMCVNSLFRWPIECPPSGIGGNGDNFNAIQRKIKSYVTSCFRRYAPSFWI